VTRPVVFTGRRSTVHPVHNRNRPVATATNSLPRHSCSKCIQRHLC